ncbi:MAG: hypothetical protein ABWY11_01645 [Umezawaea sp.]
MDTALQTYRYAVDDLVRVAEVLGLHTVAEARSRRDLATAEQRLGAVQDELADLHVRKRQAEVRLRTAEEALTGDVRAQLTRRADLDRLVEQSDLELEKLRRDLSDARISVARAEETFAQQEVRQRAAEGQRDSALAVWWEAYDAGLAQPLGLGEPERRSVESARESTRAARRELPDPADEDRVWRNCSAKLEALWQDLLPDRDARVLESEHDGAVQRVVVLADSAAGWQEPTAVADLLADQVLAQEASFDAEQQRVLSTLLGSTFIEHLKDRLDYTARTFTEIKEELTRHPARQRRAAAVGA